jgi:hypothetical protein
MLSPEVRGFELYLNQSLFQGVNMKPASNSLSVIERSQPGYAAYIGINWADQKHDICLYDPITQQFEFSVIGSQPEAIAAWAEGLRKRFAGGAILFQRRYANAICTKQKRGSLIYALCKYEFLVIYPGSPQTVAK